MNIFKLALISLSIVSPICAMQIGNESLMISHNLGKIKLYRDTHGFTLKQNKELHSIANHDVDPLLRKANPDQLKEFLKAGYIKVKQANNGEFSLSSHTRGLGGGPIFAWWGYWATKGFIYGTVGTAAAAGATKLIGSAAGLSAAPGAAAAMAGTYAAGTLGTATVATGSAAVLAGSGFSAAAVVAAVETASVTVGALLSVPWLP